MACGRDAHSVLAGQARKRVGLHGRPCRGMRSIGSCPRIGGCCRASVCRFAEGATAFTMANGASAVSSRLGGRHGEARPAPAAVFPAATGHPGSRDRRPGAPGRRHLRLISSAGDRLFSRCGGRVRDRRGDRMVAARRLLDPPGFAVHRAAAGNGLVAARFLRVPFQLRNRRCSRRRRPTR